MFGQTPALLATTAVLLAVTVGLAVRLRRANARLRALEARPAPASAPAVADETLRVMFDTTVAGLAVCDPGGTLREVNPAFAALVGYSPNELRRMTVEQITHPDDYAREVAEYQPVAAGQRDGGTIRKRYVRKGGGHVWVDLYTNVVRDAAGRVTAGVGVALDVTEKRRLEEDLRASEERFRVLGDNLPAAVYQIDLAPAGGKGRFLYVSAGIERLFGVPVAAVLADPDTLYRLIHPDERAGFHAAREAAARAGVPFDREFRHLTAAGGLKWVHLRTVPGKLADGRAVWNGVIQDVTDRRRAEEALRESEERLRFTLETTQVGTWNHDLRTGVIHRTPRHDQIFGYPGLHPAFDYDTFLGHLHPDDRGGVDRTYRDAMAAGRDWEFECRIVRTDGAERWLWAKGSFHRAADGTPALTAGLVMDVTARKETEEALRRGAERYRLLFEANPHPMWVFDRETLGFLAVNDAAVRQYGWSRDEFLAMSVLDIRPPEDGPRLAALAAGLKDGDWYGPPNIWPHRRKDGSALDAEVSAHALPLDGRPAVLVLAFDVTERRRLEEHLRQAQRLDAVGQMAGGVAHDFNNLLTVAVGNLALVSLPADDPNRPLLKAVERATGRAADLTRKLLGFARRNQLVTAPTDVREVLDEVVGLVRRTLDPRIAVGVEVAADCGAVLADATLLTQAVLNLCLNARDAMPAGGSLVLTARPAEVGPADVVSHPEGRPGDFVRLTVRDTGTGMAADVRERMFEPFFTTKPVGQGTGLGLSMVQGVVQQHGGWVECLSEPGEGTRFDLYLPRSAGGVTETPRPVHHALPPGPTATDSGVLPPPLPAGPPAEPPAGGAAGPPAPVVLLVDDEAMIRELGRAVLERAGYEVLTAEDGEDAVELFTREHGRIGLVVLDATMPRLSGKDAFKKMLALAPAARILFSTGYSADDLGELDGSVGLLSKPYRPHQLLEVVRGVLGPAAGTTG